MSSIGYQSDHFDELMAQLDATIADLSELALSSLSLDQQNELLVRECALVGQAQGLQMRSMQHAMATDLSVNYGSRILTTHLVQATNQPARPLGSARALAKWLTDFPDLHDAMIDGHLSRSHVAELKSIDCPNIHHLMIRDQQLFIDAARDVVWTSWLQVVTYWLLAADPDGELTDPANPSYGMTVRTKANGDVYATILMDPVTGEAFLTMHDAELTKIERNEAEQMNDDPNVVASSIRKKNLDAFMRLMVRGWRREDGSYPDFLVNIVMSETVAEYLLARTYGHVDPDGNNPLDVDPFELPISWDDIDGRCETIRGTPIHPKHALGLLLAGRLRRMVFDATTKVASESKDFRFFTKRQRNRLLVQQRGQCALGTQTPFRWLQADHIKPHSRGGLTEPENGQMINGGENLAKRDTWPPDGD